MLVGFFLPVNQEAQEKNYIGKVKKKTGKMCFYFLKFDYWEHLRLNQSFRTEGTLKQSKK